MRGSLSKFAICNLQFAICNRVEKARLAVCAVLLFTAFGFAYAQAPGTEQITTLRQLKNLTPQQASEGPQVRLKGVVVCYDAGWHQLYLHDGHETLYFNADDFSTQ